mmetsp:Transcript_11529/g.42170  ORF Transcript_11529/g.42170 Transcript_11529/m.42170 type:complete len:203 (-) Transcript_11529:1449-2057(-)
MPKVQLLHMEDMLEALGMCSISTNKGLKCTLSEGLDIRQLLQQSFHPLQQSQRDLCLVHFLLLASPLLFCSKQISQLLLVLPFPHGHSSTLQNFDVAHFRGHHEQKRVAFSSQTRRSPHPMNIFRSFTRRIELNDMRNFGKIQPSGCNVCAQQNTTRCIAELNECLCSIRLRQVAVQLEHGGCDEIFRGSVSWKLSQRGMMK